MKKSKYTDECIENICEDKDLIFLGTELALFGKRYRRSVKFLCENHKDKGMQIRPLEKIITAKKPCQYCNHTKIRETFVEEMASINPNIEVLSDCVNTDSRIKCRCKIDGYEWEAYARALLCGEGCKICGHKKLWDSRGRITTEIFKDKLTKSNCNIKVIGEYRGVKNLIKCECLLDGCEWESYPSNLLNGSAGCPECAKRKMREKDALTNDEFVERLKKSNSNIVPLDTYFNANTKIRFLCKNHNCVFITTPRNFLYKGGKGCPYCSQSMGEKKMVKILENKGFRIKQQKTFPDCKDVEMLRFDAYDIDNNILFEYQGQQHYYPVDFAGKGNDWAQEQYRKSHRRDLIKVEYCKRNNIPLIEIPYWEFDDMEEYINNEIDKY